MLVDGRTAHQGKQLSNDGYRILLRVRYYSLLLLVEVLLYHHVQYEYLLMKINRKTIDHQPPTIGIERLLLDAKFQSLLIV